MAITIETGAVITDANTYVSVAELRAYAEARSVTLPAADADVEPLLIKATDYLNSFEAQYKGDRVSEDQELSWPRTSAYVNGFEVADDSIPKLLKKAQMQAACEIASGNDLMPTTDGRVVKRDKVDVVETEFMTAQDMGGEPSVPSFPAVDALLEPLLNSGGQLTSVRV